MQNILTLLKQIKAEKTKINSPSFLWAYLKKCLVQKTEVFHREHVNAYPGWYSEHEVRTSQGGNFKTFTSVSAEFHTFIEVD